MKPNEQKQPTESTVRNVKILSRQGKVVFEARNIESPKAWSDNAVAIAALLYLNRKEGETSVYKMVDRMVSAMRKHGRNRGYWKDGEARQFALKMRHALLEQDVAFSSPVWMNYREKAERATSSCYTLPMADSLDSITANVVVGAKIFQSGGGLGVNLSALRSSKESIRSGCLAPGPVEFMKTIAAFSRVIRSGGKDRNSSVIFILDDDHPDFLKFCEAKRFHETTLPPNCICTVRLSNRFMRAVASGGRGKWILRHRSKKKWEKVPIRKLWNTLADSIMACGEPGIQFSGTIEKWHTCPASGQINTSNPCGEFLFLNETAAVLASLNLLHFVKADMEFNITRFEEVTAATVAALNVVLDSSPYPSPSIEETTKRFRPILVGFTNLATTLEALGLPYGAKDAQDFCAVISALMTGQAYATSARLAETLGAFPAYQSNSSAMLRVIRMHRDAIDRLRPARKAEREIAKAAKAAFAEALRLGRKSGFLNAQVSAIAPTGTTSLLMDCDSNGIEPRLAYWSERMLQNGGVLNSAPATLHSLHELLQRTNGKSYTAPEIEEITKRLAARESITHLIHPADQGLFACAISSPTGRVVSPAEHLNMVAAAAPFISGGISKTVLLPQARNTSRRAVQQLLVQAWKKGVKGLTVYQMGSKSNEPLTAKGASGAKA